MKVRGKEKKEGKERAGGEEEGEGEREENGKKEKEKDDVFFCRKRRVPRQVCFYSFAGSVAPH